MYPMPTVKFAKVKEDAIIPSKRDEDAGWDIYPCFDEEYMVIAPNETKLVPTGICSAFDKEWVFILKERGSTGSRGIGQRAGIIDSGFRGEWFVCVSNHNNAPLIIGDEKFYKDTHSIMHNGTIFYPKTKAIAQALLLPVPEVEVEECTYDEIQAIKSERGSGVIGSSGK